MAEALFYVLATLSVAFGVGVVRARMPLYSVLSLLGAFFCLSAIYLMLGFPFIAATQLLVYAGAIMVLFLFVIMLLNLNIAEEAERHDGLSLSGSRLVLAAASAALLGVIGLATAQVTTIFSPEALDADRARDALDPLAVLLFSRYMLPFEAASLLLLATMVAVIVLAKRQRSRPAPRLPAAPGAREEAARTPSGIAP